MVKTTTYGSEFVAAKAATEQIMDLRNTLRYLGVPRHNMLSYHRMREATAAKILEFHRYSSSQNRSDILSKQGDYTRVKDTVRELFDCQGDIILVELWVISFLEISHMSPLIAVDINELSYLCRSKAQSIGLVTAIVW